MSEEIKTITLTEKEFKNKLKAAVIFGAQWSHGKTKVEPKIYVQRLWDNLPEFLKKDQ